MMMQLDEAETNDREKEEEKYRQMCPSQWEGIHFAHIFVYFPFFALPMLLGGCLLSALRSSLSSTLISFLLIKSALGQSSPLPPSSPAESVQDELIFVQTIWRHGDRAPVSTFPNDPNQEEAWAQGFGELTTRGMAQQLQLGKFLRKRYIDQLGLLSPHYSAKEVYVISTDTNRTIQSATANLIGMFGGGARWGIDYPDVPDWPPSYVPIPVHTYEFRKDPVGMTRTFCQRTVELFDLTTQTPEYRALNKSSVAILETVSEEAGTPIELSTLWTLIEAVTIERTHGLKPPEWATQILPQLIELNDKLIEFNSGIGLKPLLGVDFSVEIPKMLGGTFLWGLIDRMTQKVECREKDGNNSPKATDSRELCRWMGPLKYFAHSAHDMTLAALFSTFQFAHADFNRTGFPGYAACAMVELWRRTEKAQEEYYVKVLYRRDGEDALIDLTRHIQGCDKECSLDQFRRRSVHFKPEPDTETLCRTPLVYRAVTKISEDAAGADVRGRADSRLLGGISLWSLWLLSSIGPLSSLIICNF